MAFDSYKIMVFAKKIADLPRFPNAALGLTYQDLQNWWDSSPEELRISVNGIIDELDLVLPTLSTDILGDANAYTDLVAANFVLGIVADGSISRSKLSTAVQAELTNKLNKNGDTLESYTEKLLTVASATGTVTLDLSVQDVFDLTLTGNTTLAFSNIPTTGKAASCTVLIRQGGVAYSLTFPASVKFASDSVPDVSAINKTHILSFYTVNAGTRWYCTPALNFAT